ncbi:MAG: hypothetical protein KatS3mg015_2558 [Fimbriimonadales bacterium]|nr:MAG: hypothetical protein KatS3mg015_2558 [Fimbriimonadales bacterium]
MFVEASAPFEAVFDSGESGLVGTVKVKVIDNDGTTVIGPTAAGISEDGTSGIYIWNAPAAPAAIGQYTIVWSRDGTFSEGSVAVDELVVVPAGSGELPPISPPEDGGYAFGPCSSWTTSADVAACCSVAVGSDVDVFEQAAVAASQILYELSGRRFAGLCSRTVRPRCETCLCGSQVLSRVGIDFLCNSCLVSCSPSLILLADYPVREITQVKIDGAVLAPSQYKVFAKRYAMRLDNGRWPRRQNLTLPDTEEGTFSISYTYGQSPPLAGRDAAKELACEIYKACLGDEECVLPDGVSRIQRQGIVIERNAFVAWGRQEGIWRTGLPLVDLFLNTYNPSGVRRRMSFLAPGVRRFPLSA